MPSPGEQAAGSSLQPAERGGNWRQITIYSSSDDPQTIDIPANLDSLETLIYCGFDEDIASTFILPEWERQNAMFPERDRTLMDEALRYIRSKSLDENDDLRASLKTLGLSTDLIDRMMNPEYDIRHGGTPRFLATVSVQAAYSYLNDLFKEEETKEVEEHATSWQDEILHAWRVYST